MLPVKVYVDCSFSMGRMDQGKTRLDYAISFVSAIQAEITSNLSVYGFNSSLFHFTGSVKPCGAGKFHRIMCSALLYAVGGDEGHKAMVFLTDHLSVGYEEIVSILNSLTLDGWLVCIKQVGNDWTTTTTMKQLKREVRWKKWVEVFPAGEEDQDEIIEALENFQCQ